MALGLAGHTDEAKRLLQEFWGSLRVPVFQAWKNYLLAWLEGRSSDMVAGIQGIGQLKIQLDPEAMFMLGWLLCDVGKYDEGLAYLQRAVTKGYSPAATLASSQQFDRLRGNFAFQTLLADAVAGRQRALSEFREIGGDRLIGELVSA
jgi:hypothetical protein